MATGCTYNVYNYPENSLICLLGYNQVTGSEVFGPLTSKQIKIEILESYDIGEFYISSENQNEISFSSLSNNQIIDIPEQFWKENPIYFRNYEKLEIDNQIQLPTQIQITCSTPDSQIYYTTDNSEPNKQSNLYSDIFEVEEGTTIKAKAYKEGYIESDIAELTIE